MVECKDCLWGSPETCKICAQDRQEKERREQEREPVCVPVRRKEQSIEQPHPIRKFPPDWKPEPIPRRWII